MEQGYLEFNNGKIYYEVEGVGEAIIFVNGFTLDRRMWQEQVEHFSKKYTVVTYDKRGHGKSSIPTGEYSHEDDLSELINKLQLKNIILAGLSLGGEISINYALKNLDNIKKLVLADSSLDGYKSTVNWDVQGKKENWLNHELFNGTKQNPVAYEKVKRIVDDYSGWHFVNNDLWQKPKDKAIDLLGQLSVPTMIITGELDLPYFQNIADYVMNHAPNTKREVVLNAGHMVNMEKPGEFNKIVEEFI